MSPGDLFNRVRRRTAAALVREAELERVLAKRAGEPPWIGDVFVFRETADHGLFWVVLDVTADGGTMLVVPADTSSLIGTTDVATRAGDLGGSLTLRCAHGVWLSADKFDPRLRTGGLDLAAVGRARAKHRAGRRGELRGSGPEREIDADPAHVEWLEVVVAGCAALIDGESLVESAQAERESA